MIAWIRTPNYSNLATLNTPFTYNSNQMVSAYIIPGTTGDIVWINSLGEAQFLPAAQANQKYDLGAVEIVSTALVNGVSRSTTATNIAWFAINQLNNNP